MPAGRPKNIESPEKLMEYFMAYKKHVKANPKYESVWDYKSGQVAFLPKEKPLTLYGFEDWLYENGIIYNLDDYRKNDGTNGDYSEYTYILRVIEKKIYDDKYSGAVAGVFQHNIIARDLGLRDGQDHTSKGDKMEFPTEIKITRVEPKS